MEKKTINRSLSLQTSGVVVLLACLIVGGVEWQALKAKEPKVKSWHNFKSSECIRCHNDKQSMVKMRQKEDGAHYLFDSEGKFKDPKLTNYNPDDYRAKGAADWARK